MTDLIRVLSLARREWSRFLRQPSRSLSAAASPLLLWIFIGSGLDEAFRPAGSGAEIGFLEYFYPGTILLLVLYGALFANATLIQDRHEGFLQGVLVSPAAGWPLVVGKVFGGAAQGWAQSALLLVVAPLVGIRLTPVSLVATLGVLALLALGLTAIGFAVAWQFDSLQGFHSIMNLVLAPLWMLSGAFFPLTSAPHWLETVMRVNPLTYALTALRRALYADDLVFLNELPAWGPSLAVVLLLMVAGFAVSRALVARGARV